MTEPTKKDMKSFGPWHYCFEDRTIEYTGTPYSEAYPYWIPVNEELFQWISHLQGKTWFSEPDVESSFRDLLDWLKIRVPVSLWDPTNKAWDHFLPKVKSELFRRLLKHSLSELPTSVCETWRYNVKQKLSMRQSISEVEEGLLCLRKFTESLDTGKEHHKLLKEKIHSFVRRTFLDMQELAAEVYPKDNP